MAKKTYIWFCNECEAENTLTAEETDYISTEETCSNCGVLQPVEGLTD
jgi:hypothetical protein